MSGAGDFRTRLMLQFRDDRPDGQGGYTRSFSDAGKIWARVTPLKGREQVVADSDGALQRVRIEVRAPCPITLAHRLIDGATVYRITSYRYEDRVVTIDAQTQLV